MPDVALAETFLVQSPGEIITSLVLKLSSEHGHVITPRFTTAGTRFPLRGGFLRGSGELVVIPEEGGVRIRLVGTPPPWPLSIGWASRVMRRHFGFGPITTAVAEE